MLLGTCPQQQAGGGQGAPLDRFGLLGLLGVIRMSDPDLTTLALGTDLTGLGLHLNSPRERLQDLRLALGRAAAAPRARVQGAALLINGCACWPMRRSFLPAYLHGPTHARRETGWLTITAVVPKRMAQS